MHVVMGASGASFKAMARVNLCGALRGLTSPNCCTYLSKNTVHNRLRVEICFRGIFSLAACPAAFTIFVLCKDHFSRSTQTPASHRCVAMEVTTSQASSTGS